MWQDEAQKELRRGCGPLTRIEMKIVQERTSIVKTPKTLAQCVELVSSRVPQGVERSPELAQS
jgi:hypothetical protein